MSLGLGFFVEMLRLGGVTNKFWAFINMLMIFTYSYNFLSHSQTCTHANTHLRHYCFIQRFQLEENNLREICKIKPVAKYPNSKTSKFVMPCIIITTNFLFFSISTKCPLRRTPIHAAILQCFDVKLIFLVFFRPNLDYFLGPLPKCFSFSSVDVW